MIFSLPKVCYLDIESIIAETVRSLEVAVQNCGDCVVKEADCLCDVEGHSQLDFVVQDDFFILEHKLKRFLGHELGHDVIMVVSL